MRFYFAGADQPVSLAQLETAQAENVAISFYEWRQRFQDNDLSRIPATMGVCLTPGMSKKNAIDFDLWSRDYVEFVEDNIDRLDLVFDLDSLFCPYDIAMRTRAALQPFHRFVVFPTPDEDVDSLIAQMDPNYLGINATRSKSTQPFLLRRLKVPLVGSNIASQKTLTECRFTASTNHVWLGARRYGELWVWDRKMHHYKADNLDRAVKLHRNAIAALGVDPEACLANDPKALIQTAIKSFQRLEAHLTARLRDRSADIADVSGNGHSKTIEESIASHPAALSLVPAPERRKVLLPVLDPEMVGDQAKLTALNDSIRKCDSCYLQDLCPEFRPGPDEKCAFSIPISFNDQGSWVPATKSLLAMQYQRAAFAVFAEQIDDGKLTPVAGHEMDRFFRLLKLQQDMEGQDGSLPKPEGALTRAFSNINRPTTNGANDGNEEDPTEEDDNFEEAELEDLDLFHDRQPTE